MTETDGNGSPAPKFTRIDEDLETQAYRAQQFLSLSQQLWAYELSSRQAAILVKQDPSLGLHQKSVDKVYIESKDRVDRLRDLLSDDHSKELQAQEKQWLEEQIVGCERGILQNQELLNNADVYWLDSERSAKEVETQRNVRNIEAQKQAAEEMLSNLDLLD